MGRSRTGRFSGVHRGRTLALAGDIAEIIKRREQTRLVERDGDVRVADLVFHRHSRSIGDFKRAWHAALVAADLSHAEKDPTTGKVRTVYDKCFHDFRRTAVRNLVRSGVRKGVAMQVTGHTTRSVLDRYCIVSGDDVREAMERVSAR